MRRLEGVALNVLALCWLGRALWRVSHGRAPWKGAS
jgi:hypothetical protein